MFFPTSLLILTGVLGLGPLVVRWLGGWFGVASSDRLDRVEQRLGLVDVHLDALDAYAEASFARIRSLEAVLDGLDFEDQGADNDSVPFRG